MRNSNTTTTTKKLITIALSEEAPVKVDGSLWPIIARTEWHDGKVECQANHVRFIRVRQHDDGRRIVYGRLESGPGGVHAGWRGAHAGYRIEAVDRNREKAFAPGNFAPDEDATIRAIRRVAGAIGDDQMGDDCIADLPAKELV